MRKYINIAGQFGLITIAMIVILLCLGAGIYLIWSSLSFVIFKFIIGVASFSIGLILLNLTRHELLKPN